MALDWQSRVAALNALSLTGADAKNRTTTISRLTSHGEPYDATRAYFGESACDAAKASGDAAFVAANASWATATQPVHDSADQFARFVDGGPPIAFAPDGSAGPALFDRLAAAETTLSSPEHPKSKLKEELAVHTQAASKAYGERPTTPSYPHPYSTRTGLLGGIPIKGISRAYNLHEYERDVLGPSIAEADLLIDELT